MSKSLIDKRNALIQKINEWDLCIFFCIFYKNNEHDPVWNRIIEDWWITTTVIERLVNGFVAVLVSN